MVDRFDRFQECHSGFWGSWALGFNSRKSGTTLLHDVSSGVTGGGQSAHPETFDREISADLLGKKRQERKKVKRGEN